MAFRWKRKKFRYFMTDVERKLPQTMKKTTGFVFDRYNGKVLPWHQCVVVDVESMDESNAGLWLDWIEYGDISAARRLAQSCGVPLDYLAMSEGAWND